MVFQVSVPKFERLRLMRIYPLKPFLHRRPVKTSDKGDHFPVLSGMLHSEMKSESKHFLY